MIRTLSPKVPDVFADGAEVLNVALCQIETVQWDVPGNVARTLAALNEAADQGAELAITPECVFHGYGFDFREDYQGAMREIAEPLDGPNLASVKDVSRARGLDVVVGFAEAGEGGRMHNSAAMISKGELLWVYRKVHCRPFESAEFGAAFTPGEHFYVNRMKAKAGEFGVGVMICFDREIPESVRALRSLGAEIIACPLATGATDANACVNWADNEMITRCRAAENELFIAVVNHASRYNGGSFVVGPAGDCLIQMGEAPGVETLPLPVGGVRKHMHSDPWGWMGWGYRRPEVYDRYLSASPEA